MKKDKYINQGSPFAVGFWIKNNIKNGMVVKKKNINTINIKEKSKDDKEGDIIVKLLLYLRRFFL